MADEHPKPITRRNPDHEDTWDGECPSCGYTSIRHLTRKDATARIVDHQAEHGEGDR